MNSEALRKFLKASPFEPIEVFLSSGQSYQIRHPENAIVMKNTLVVAEPETDGVAWCSLFHVASIQKIPVEKHNSGAGGTNGAL